MREQPLPIPPEVSGLRMVAISCPRASDVKNKPATFDPVLYSIRAVIADHILDPLETEGSASMSMSLHAHLAIRPWEAAPHSLGTAAETSLPQDGVKSVPPAILFCRKHWPPSSSDCGAGTGLLHPQAVVLEVTPL
ncbi:uncharacterized protein [Symphalangus syndactylus]|uniref:uncharacterized protein n=1 Tax=Symphalangus syndactylus TaxID=9590 RepID=UPI0030065049